MTWRWQVGAAEIVRVDDSNFTLPSEVAAPAWAVPDFVPSTGELPSAFSAIAIHVDGQRIVVDPWLANDGPRARADAAHQVGRLLDALAAEGFAPDDVDVVINTHIDGTGWNSRPSDDDPRTWVPSFPRARYLFPRAELDAVDRGVEIAGGEETEILRAAGVVEPIDAPYEVSPSIRVVDAPGHNEGHWTVRIESDGEIAAVPGHIILSLLHLDDPGYDVGEQRLDVATATREALLGELAERDGVLVTTLIGGPGGGTVRRRDGGYRLEPSHT